MKRWERSWKDSRRDGPAKEIFTFSTISRSSLRGSTPRNDSGLYSAFPYACVNFQRVCTHGGIRLEGVYGQRVCTVKGCVRSEGVYAQKMCSLKEYIHSKGVDVQRVCTLRGYVHSKVCTLKSCVRLKSVYASSSSTVPAAKWQLCDMVTIH